MGWFDGICLFADARCEKGPDKSDGKYWETSTALKTASDEKRVHQLCEYPDEYQVGEDGDSGASSLRPLSVISMAGALALAML